MFIDLKYGNFKRWYLIRILNFKNLIKLKKKVERKNRDFMEDFLYK